MSSIPQFFFRENLSKYSILKLETEILKLTFLKTVFGRYPENLKLLACTGADPGPSLWEVRIRNCIIVAQIVKSTADDNSL